MSSGRVVKPSGRSPPYFSCSRRALRTKPPQKTLANAPHLRRAISLSSNRMSSSTCVVRCSAVSRRRWATCAASGCSSGSLGIWICCCSVPRPRGPERSSRPVAADDQEERGFDRTLLSCHRLSRSPSTGSTGCRSHYATGCRIRHRRCASCGPPSLATNLSIAYQVLPARSAPER